MEFIQKNKKILIIVGVAVLVVIIYEMFFAGGSTAPNAGTGSIAGGLVSEISASPADAIVGHDLLVMLAQLHSISLDSSVFSDRSFTCLVDKGQPINLQPSGKSLGRRNPFGDFARLGSTTATVSQPANLFATSNCR